MDANERLADWKIMWRNLWRGPDKTHLLNLELERQVRALKLRLSDLERGEWVNRMLEAEAELAKWRKIADRLVNGAECQLDDIRSARLPLDNPKWIEAWRAYDKAVDGER